MKKPAFSGLPEYAVTVRTQRGAAMLRNRQRQARRIAGMGLPVNHAHYRLGSLMTRPVPVLGRVTIAA